jgi:hypothetical protein
MSHHITTHIFTPYAYCSMRATVAFSSPGNLLENIQEGHQSKEYYQGHGMKSKK